MAGVGRRKNCSAVLGLGVQQKRADGDGFRVRFQCRQERWNGGGQHLHFRRHEEQIFAGRGAGADVERLGAPEVARQPQHGDIGKLGIQLRAFVVRTAIHHQDFDGSPIVGSFERGQAAAQGRRAVVGKNQRRHFDGGRKIDFLRLRLGLDCHDGGGLAGFNFTFAGNGHVWSRRKAGLVSLGSCHQAIGGEQVHFGGAVISAGIEKRDGIASGRLANIPGSCFRSALPRERRR